MVSKRQTWTRRSDLFHHTLVPKRPVSSLHTPAITRCANTYYPLGGNQGSRLLDMIVASEDGERVESDGSHKHPHLVNGHMKNLLVAPTEGRWAVTLNEVRERRKGGGGCRRVGLVPSRVRKAAERRSGWGAYCVPKLLSYFWILDTKEPECHRCYYRQLLALARGVLKPLQATDLPQCMRSILILRTAKSNRRTRAAGAILDGVLMLGFRNLVCSDTCGNGKHTMRTGTFVHSYRTLFTASDRGKFAMCGLRSLLSLSRACITSSQAHGTPPSIIRLARAQNFSPMHTLRKSCIPPQSFPLLTHAHAHNNEHPTTFMRTRYVPAIFSTLAHAGLTACPRLHD